jgi:DNA-nicking Smr family endonuclease
MSSRPRRRLTREESALWTHVVADARPMHAAPATAADPVRPADAPAAVSVPPARPVAAPDKPPARPAQAPQPPRLDGRLAARLARGRLAPEARIDLHGLTLAEAHPALAGFLARAQERGVRLVLVITGKGGAGSDTGDGPFPAGRGVLRRQVPHWLRQPPLAGRIVESREAHPRHGGAGAFYVWLRRPRGRPLQTRNAGG